MLPHRLLEQTVICSSITDSRRVKTPGSGSLGCTGLSRRARWVSILAWNSRQCSASPGSSERRSCSS